jgi:hypothetical protein
VTDECVFFTPVDEVTPYTPQHSENLILPLETNFITCHSTSAIVRFRIKSTSSNSPCRMVFSLLTHSGSPQSTSPPFIVSDRIVYEEGIQSWVQTLISYLSSLQSEFFTELENSESALNEFQIPSFPLLSRLSDCEQVSLFIQLTQDVLHPQHHTFLKKSSQLIL